MESVSAKDKKKAVQQKTEPPDLVAGLGLFYDN